MPLHLELGSGAHKFIGKAIVVDTKGHHYSTDPIPIERAKKQMGAIYAAKNKK